MLASTPLPLPPYYTEGEEKWGIGRKETSKNLCQGTPKSGICPGSRTQDAINLKGYRLPASLRQAPDEFMSRVRLFHQWMGHALPGGSDIDLVAERRGKFLFLEGKPVIGEMVYVPLGQWLMLEALSREGNKTVYLVGDRHDIKLWSRRAFCVARITPELNGVRVFRNGIKEVRFNLDEEPWQDVSVKGLQKIAAQWWQGVERDR